MNKQKLDYLQDMYSRWLERYGYAAMSADELLYELDPKDTFFTEHAFWLKWFIEEWERASNE